MNFFEQVLIGLITSITTLAGSYLIYGPKLRLQQKTEFQKSIGEKKAAALLELKEIINECSKLELFAGEEELGSQMLYSVVEQETPVYASVLEDIDSLISFQGAIKTYRIEKEMYLGREAAACVVYIDKYLDELIDFMRVYYPHVAFPVIGTFVYYDLLKWAEKADAVALRDINEARTDMESHKDNDWIKTRNAIVNDLYDNSLLKKIQNPPKQRNSEEAIVLLDYIDYLDSCEKQGKMNCEEMRIDSNNIGKKPRRNEMCPCGSGKKYKNCCGKE